MYREDREEDVRTNAFRARRTFGRSRLVRLLPAVLGVCLLMVAAGALANSGTRDVRAATPAMGFTCNDVSLLVSPVYGYTSQSTTFVYQVTNDTTVMGILHVTIEQFALSYSWGPSYDWNPETALAAGETVTYTNVQTTPATPGDYSVTISSDIYSVFSLLGAETVLCTWTADFNFQPVPVVTITDSAPTGIAPLAEQFTSSVVGGFSPYSYAWSFGDGSPISTLADPTHTYLGGGSYTVTFGFADAVSATATLYLEISVYTSLIPSAGATPTSGTVPLTVYFTGSASGGSGGYSYSWNFGDGSPTSALASPTHVYTSSGTYTAALTVTDSNGDVATAYAPAVTVTAGPALTATASASPTSGTAPLTVTFTGTAGGGTGPYSYAWAFGDGTTGSGASVQHTYTTAGTFTATLTVTDSASPADTATASAPSVTVSAATTLSAAVSANPTSGVAPLTVTFVGTGAGGTAPYTYSWTFGDGTTGAGATVQHTYSGVGTYTATLTVTDSLGHTAVHVVTISVSSSPGGGGGGSGGSTTSSGISPWVWVGAAVAILVVALAAYLVVHGRRKPVATAPPAG